MLRKQWMEIRVPNRTEEEEECQHCGGGEPARGELETPIGAQDEDEKQKVTS